MDFSEIETEIIAQFRKIVRGGLLEPQVTGAHQEEETGASNALPFEGNAEETRDLDAESRRVREECRRRWAEVGPFS